MGLLSAERECSNLVVGLFFLFAQPCVFVGVTAVVLAVLPAFFGILLFQAEGDVLALVSGIVLGVDGMLDPYAWRDVELAEKVVVSNVGSGHHEVREKLLLVGPLGRSTQFLVPSRHRETVIALAKAGGATIV